MQSAAANQDRLDQETAQANLLPLRRLIDNLTVNGIFAAVSLIVLAFWAEVPSNLIAAAGVILLIVLGRWQSKRWLNKQRVRRSATALALGYLLALWMIVLLVGDPLIVPLIIIE